MFPLLFLATTIELTQSVGSSTFSMTPFSSSSARWFLSGTFIDSGIRRDGNCVGLMVSSTSKWSMGPSCPSTLKTPFILTGNLFHGYPHFVWRCQDGIGMYHRLHNAIVYVHKPHLLCCFTPKKICATVIVYYHKVDFVFFVVSLDLLIAPRIGPLVSRSLHYTS